MHLDIGTIVWLIVVLIGVVSSLRKNAKKRMKPAAPVTPSVHAQAFEPPVMAVPVPQYVSAPAAVPAPPPDIPAPPEIPPLLGFPIRPIGTSPVRGMFEGPATLVRAIVAAEVLGPPKSLQEQSIWSPRHSEPSI